MTVKRSGAALLLLALSTALLTGCTGKADAATARIAVLKGPTAMGMVRLMDEAERAENSPYSYTLAGSPDEQTPKLVRGELDMAALPANLAAVLHQNSGGRIRMLAANTLGVLDIVGRAPAPPDFSGLKGRTIYAAGKGSSPEFVLRDLMQEAGLNPDMDVELRWNSEQSEVTAELAAALRRGEDALALLPQPFVTAALDAVEGLSVLLELNDEWALRHPDSSLVTGVLAARRSAAAALRRLRGRRPVILTTHDAFDAALLDGRIQRML